ncbi:MAG: helix-turn-helix domain-containing protein [Gallionella sp.]|jgi:excisionase family DNA binding protein
MSNETLMTVANLAEYLQLDEQTVYKKVEAGELPAIKVGGVYRFRKPDIDRWLDTQQTKKGKQ